MRKVEPGCFISAVQLLKKLEKRERFIGFLYQRKKKPGTPVRCCLQQPNKDNKPVTMGNRQKKKKNRNR